jgi:hypothetical protein
MAARVPGQKRDAVALQGADDDRVGGISEWRADAGFPGRGEAGHSVEPATANDSDRHGILTG